MRAVPATLPLALARSTTALSVLALSTLALSTLALSGCTHTMPPSIAHRLAGGVAPSFEAPTEGGGVAVPSTSPLTRVTVVDFWASWCGTCADSFPALNALYGDLRERGVTVVGVSVDDDESLAWSAAARFGARFPIAFDGGQRIAAAYGVSKLPTTFVLDRRSRVRFVGRDPREVREAVLALLDEP